MAHSVTFASSVLRLDEGTAEVASLRLTGSYTSADFMLHADGAGGTLIATTSLA